MLESWAAEIKSIAAGWKYGDFEVQSPLEGQAEGRYIDIGANVKLYTEDTGGDGEVLFFLYGLGCSIGHWKHQIKYFWTKYGSESSTHKKYRIVWMDFRGHGKSQAGGQAGDYRIDTFVHDIESVFKSLRIKNATILGQSMGGSLALSFASNYPERVNNLILQGSPPFSPSKSFNVNKLGRSGWNAMIKLNRVSPIAIRLLYRGLPTLGRPLMEAIRIVGFNASLVSVEDVREYTEALIASNPNVFWELAGDLENFDIGTLPNQITARTLVLAGCQDNCVTPDAINYLASHLPNSQVVFLEHGSHCPHLDDPPLINEMIDRFLSA
jgi:2-succinyl-6-hydroxy-2,4-cyclohexadiene-1-carboxylate synthase